MAFDPGAIAQDLLAQHGQRRQFKPVMQGGKLLEIDQAYRVQEQYVAQLRLDHAAEVAGYKIGLTSSTMQEMCGIGHPVYGCVLQSRVAQSPCEASLAAYGRLGVEFEIAARLGQDLVLHPGEDALARAQACVDAVAVALELVDDRSADYKQLDAGSLIADNAWNAGVVLGAWTPVPAGLAGSRGELFLGGKPVDEGVIGSGAAHPLASVAWLAQALAAQGRVLARGSLVMTGSIVRTRFPAAGERWRFEVEGLGAVEMSARP